MKSFIIASFSTGKTGHDDAKWLPREKEYINEFTSEKCNISPKREREREQAKCIVRFGTRVVEPMAARIGTGALPHICLEGYIVKLIARWLTEKE
jgi:hypothetical protein